MKALLITLLTVLLSGCATTYEIQRCEGNICSFAKIRTYREFTEGTTVRYDRDTGEFLFEAGSVTTAESPIEKAAANAINRAVDVASGRVIPPPTD